MKKYNNGLVKYITQKRQVSVVKFLNICRSVLNAFEIIHNAGYVYNNLKLENIMISGQKNGNFNVRLIDYKMATKYIINGRHI